MTEKSGRLMIIKLDGVAVAGARENGFTVDNSPVNITDLASGGIRTLASFSGVRSFDLNVTGLFSDKIFRELALAASPLMTVALLEFADGATMTSDLYISNYTETGVHDAEVTFTATLQSSGTWTYVTAV